MLRGGAVSPKNPAGGCAGVSGPALGTLKLMESRGSLARAAWIWAVLDALAPSSCQHSSY